MLYVFRIALNILFQKKDYEKKLKLCQLEVIAIKLKLKDEQDEKSRLKIIKNEMDLLVQSLQKENNSLLTFIQNENSNHEPQKNLTTNSNLIGYKSNNQKQVFFIHRNKSSF